VTSPAPTADRPRHADANVLEAALYWGDSLLAVRRLKGEGALTLGSRDDVDLYIADAQLVAAHQTFVVRQGDEVWLQPVEGMAITIDDDAAPPVAARLMKGSAARLSVGALEIRLRWTDASRRIAVPLLGGLDFLYTKVLATALVLQAAFVAGMMLTPTFPDDDDSLIAQAVRWVQVQAPREKTPPPPKPIEVKVKQVVATSKQVFGQERTQVAKAKTSVKRDQRELAEAAANEVLAAMFGAEGKRGGGSGVFNNLPATVDGLGKGSKPAGDGGGWGTRGTGPGGGGNAIGIGGLRSGKGGFSGGDDVVGSLCGGQPCKKRYAVTRVGSVKTVGGLKKEEIQRVVNRHLSQIKACFNRELTKDPNLDGKLTMAWVIGGSGLVVMSKVSQDTVGSPAMSACVRRIVKRMRFPKPRGGGTVNVRYPFLFST
jgi:hypothetical protein